METRWTGAEDLAFTDLGPREAGSELPIPSAVLSNDKWSVK